ncbi:DUF5056 domain-containing protein [Bacteroides sp. 214]|uniref:DUF5056 domain-containing protein n=1 Tax=Bacteroides sp. 214 TaxID=2302935 RepID=UPI0013D2FC00|nr:DUF5056 domain-containing protein [Bacteroides sp. 214]NDW13395.1 DUF5056 domain-containing protein [Bacteroides sp. 214]
MKENDDILLKEFFNQNKQEIEDNGFSSRVMKNLPGRENKRIAQILTILCAVVSILLFILLDGVQNILGALQQAFINIVQHGITAIDITTLLGIATVVVYLGFQRINSYTTE